MTILYRGDWDTYPLAEPDWTTSSKTAIRMALFYNQVGKRKNFDFILALHNPDLKGVDPRDPNLTNEQKAAIAVEVKQNFWYYLREIVKVPGKGGVDGQPFRFHRGNIAVFWSLLNTATTWYLGPRQLAGKSLTIDIINSWIMLAAGKNSNINLLTKDDGLRTTNLNRLRDIRKELPEYLQLNDKLDVSNTSEFTVSLLNNRYVGHVPAGNAKDAIKKGRGFTSEFNHLDEPAFQNFIGKAVPAMLTAGTMARRIAREHNNPNYTAFTTTAGSLTDRDGKECYKLLSGAVPWSDGFFDLEDRETFKKLIISSGRSDKFAVNCTFYYYMLGFTEDDIKEAIRDSESTDIVDIEKDFYVKWYRGTGTSVLDRRIIAKLESNKRTPKDDSSTGILINYYYNKGKKKIRPNQPFLLILDPSEGINKDALGLLGVDPYTGETLFATTCYNSNIVHFSKWLFDNFIVPYPKSMFMIEARMGRGIIDNLLLLMKEAHIDPFKRMFNFLVSGTNSELVDEYNRLSITMGREFDRFVESHRSKFGFPTSGSGVTSRSNLYGRTLRECSTMRAHVAYDTILIDQLTNLVERNGRVDHPVGMHDDLCIPWVLSHWFLTQSANVGMYGFDVSKILKYIPFDATSSSEEDISAEEYARRSRKHDRQQMYRKELNKLVKKLSKTDDPILTNMLRSNIEYVKSKIRLKPNEDLTLSYLQQQLEEGNLEL